MSQRRGDGSSGGGSAATRQASGSKSSSQGQRRELRRQVRRHKIKAESRQLQDSGENEVAAPGGQLAANNNNNNKTGRSMRRRVSTSGARVVCAKPVKNITQSFDDSGGSMAPSQLVVADNKQQQDIDELVSCSVDEGLVSGGRIVGAARGSCEEVEQIMDFSLADDGGGKRRDTNCSLCHYLDSIQAISVQQQQQQGLDNKVAAPCDHQHKPVSCTNHHHNGPHNRRRTVNQIGDGALCCCDAECTGNGDKGDIEPAASCGSCGKRRLAPESGVGSATIRPLDSEPVDEEEDKSVASKTETALAEDGRPSSAHSRLCPTSAGSVLVESYDNYDVNLDESDGEESKANKRQQQQQQQPRLLRGAHQRAPLMKALRGGLSLDANNNRQRLNDYHHRHHHSKLAPDGPRQQATARHPNSKSSLAGQRCKSNSSKLIVINSHNVSYTIQGKWWASFLGPTTDGANNSKSNHPLGLPAGGTTATQHMTTSSWDWCQLLAVCTSTANCNETNSLRAVGSHKFSFPTVDNHPSLGDRLALRATRSSARFSRTRRHG